VATDRIFLVCDICKEYIYLHNWSPGNGVYIDKKKVGHINDFLYEHELCVNKSMEVNNAVGISFGNESKVWKVGHTEYKEVKENKE